MYRLMTIVLEIILGLVMNKLISPNQFVFLKGRMLVDGVVVVNEVINFAKRSNKSCLIFKTNFEKAYDSVS